jgi:Trehalose-6-phosphate synthase
MKRGGGGLVSTLLPFMASVKGTWIASAMTDGDRKMAETHEKCMVPIPEDNPDFCVSFIAVDPEIYKDYYSVISNPLSGLCSITCGILPMYLKLMIISIKHGMTVIYM